MESFELSLSPAQLNQTRRALAQCNEASARYGRVLSEAQMAALARRRSQALRSTGRVEFGEGVLPKLARAFCSSSCIQPADYADTLAELQDLFYQLKGDCRERLADDELIDAMVLVFQRTGGSLEFLSGMEPDELCQIARTGSLDGTRLDGEM